MVWRQAGSHSDQDPSIISRIVRSPRVGSVSQRWRRQEDQWAMARHVKISGSGWRDEVRAVGRRAVSCPNGNKTGATAGRLQ